MKPPFPSFRVPRGTALVVVLMFVVLLSVVVLAFFMKSSAFRSLSQSGVSEFKADTLGHGALEMLVADLRQEIADGSEVVTVGNTTLFLPNTPASAVPRRAGNPPVAADGTDPIPNLIRRSVRADPSPGLAGRASASSSQDPARNRKFISPARWNKHYLIPRDPALYGGGNSTVVGTDPVPEFAVPDWVYMTPDGPEVLTTSDRRVIGRFAYAIYDEGGLLDINVAGYPANTPVKADDPADTQGKVWGSGHKGALASAKLSVLGLNQNEIDQIVGWRTFATSRPTGTFPNLTFDSAGALRYHNAARAHPFAFLQVPETTVTSGGKTQGDQAFTSRQQLLQFRNRVGFSQDALQYLGTFSRDLDQPSFVPHPGRPRVQSGPNTNHTTYGTGNDAHGVDREADRSRDINPPFPLVRVTTPFTRADGTEAQAGEPLVNKRFPLSRLSRILRTATASKDPSDPIYRDFGLYRSNASEPWRYDHGDPTGILRLDAVAAAGREPDFFELLKAAITVGSLGKGSANPGWTDAGRYSQMQHDGHDVLVNLQLLQIGANIIDLYDSDGYPTRLAFAGDLIKEVRGAESLPYLHRARLRFVSSPDVPAAPPAAGSYPGTIMLNPEIWNPHGSDTPSEAPNRFRIRAENSLGAGMPTTCKFVYKNSETQAVSVDWSTGGVLTFETDGSHFREPVVLAKPNVPSGTGLAGETRIDDLAEPPTNVAGIVVADFERKMNNSDVDNAFLGEPDHGPVTLYLEYWDGSGYRVYDQMMFEWVNSKFSPKGNWGDYQAKIKYDGWARTDPRTPRWGASMMELFYLIDPLNAGDLVFSTGWPSLSLPPYGPKAGFPQDRGFVNAFANYPNNDNPPSSESKHRGFTQGYWTQNTVRNQQGHFGMVDKPFYNRDPDGIARRAMGAYASDPASGGSFSTTEGLPMITGNAGSRPLILNRPFRSVAELGYTFRGTPWKNLDFSFPESGDAALLDVFTVEEIPTDEALVAGRLNLNTRQRPVLQAVLAGAIAEDFSGTPGLLDDDVALAIADKLVDRTTSSDPDKGPLRNRAELVGRWTGTSNTPTVPGDANPDVHYAGFASDVGTADGVTGTPLAQIPAQRESVMRALSDAGTTRTWNLMIDLIAQSGRFPTDGDSLDSFQVEGEKRYWLHVAIDRLTGEVLDRQLEIVTE